MADHADNSAECESEINQYPLPLICDDEPPAGLPGRVTDGRGMGDHRFFCLAIGPLLS